MQSIFVSEYIDKSCILFFVVIGQLASITKWTFVLFNRFHQSASFTT